MAKEKVKLTTPVFRGAFTQGVFEKREGKDGGKPKYSLTAIWTPNDFSAKDKALWSAIKAQMDAECMRVFKMSWADCKRPVDDGGIEGFKSGIRNGKSKADLDGFGEGTFFATLSSQYAPGVVDVNKDTISKEEDNTDEVYAGAYYRATVGVYAYSNKRKGVAIGLNNLQKIKDGERLDGRGNVGDDFDEEVDSSWIESNEPSLDDDIPF
jgi:hypothetical protein